MSDSLDRRTALQAAGLAAAGLGLASCSAEQTSTANSAMSKAASAASSAGSAVSSAAANASSAASSAASQAAAAASDIATSKVPVGGGVIVPALKVVFTQPTAGQFKAFDTTCPHEGCAVSRIESAEIVCVCHNSRFAIADGARLAGPAQTGLTEKKITVSGNGISVS